MTRDSPADFALPVRDNRLYAKKRLDMSRRMNNLGVDAQIDQMTTDVVSGTERSLRALIS
jgi:hypothetical protein